MFSVDQIDDNVFDIEQGEVVDISHHLRHLRAFEGVVMDDRCGRRCTWFAIVFLLTAWCTCMLFGKKESLNVTHCVRI